jgi:hypothetical protein
MPELAGVGADLAGAALISRMEKPTAPTIPATAVAQALTTVPAQRDGHERAPGLPRRPVTQTRLIGDAVLLAGVALLQLG